MIARAVLDGIVSSYYYKKYFSARRYFLYLLKNIRPVNFDSFVDKIINISLKFNHKYTLFITGAFIVRFSGQVKKLSELGHEIGYHSYNHVSSLWLSDKEFENDIARGKKLFYDLGLKLNGYRAPNLMFDDNHYFILRKFGLRYSSSKYFNRPFYEIINNFYEIPVGFMDAIDYCVNSSSDGLRRSFYPNNIHLYHPYGLLSDKNEQKLLSIFTSIDVPIITISELLNGKEGMCITIDIGI